MIFTIYDDKNTIRNEDSTSLYTVYTVDTVDMVYTADMAYTADTVDTD